MSNEKPAILVITSDSELEESVRTILENSYRLEYAENLDKAIAQVSKLQPDVCLVDFAIATSDSDAIDLLKDEKTDLVVVVLCPRDKSDEVVASHINRDVFRILFVPLATGQTKLAVTAAFKQSIEQHLKPKKVETATKKPSSIKPLPIIIGLSVIVLAAIGGLFLTKSNNAKVEAQNIKTLQLQQVQAEDKKIKQLLLFANGAKNAKNYFPPKANNALNSYLSVLEKQPDNTTAKTALDELSYLALGDFDLHFSNGSADEAISSVGIARDSAANNEMFANMVENVLEQKRVGSFKLLQDFISQDKVSDAANILNTYIEVFEDDSDELYAIEEQIEERKASLNRESEITGLLAKSKTALTSNRLLTPNQNNARYYLNRLENAEPAHPELIGLKENLASLLLTASNRALADIDFSGAKRFTEAAAALGTSPQIVTTQRNKIISAETEFTTQQAAATAEAIVQEQEQEQEKNQRESEEALKAEQESQEAERLEKDKLDKAAEEKLAADTKAALEILLATPVKLKLSDLRYINRVSPNYPRRYQQRGLQGSALVSFQVNRDGTTSNVTPVSTKPERAKEFGMSAVKAVEQWTFEPYKDSDGNVRLVYIEFNSNFQL